MIEIEIRIEEGQTLNLGQLDIELRKALGDTFQGLSYAGRDIVRLHFDDVPPVGGDHLPESARQIIARHVPEPDKAPGLSLEERLAMIEARLDKLEGKQ